VGLSMQFYLTNAIEPFGEEVVTMERTMALPGKNNSIFDNNRLL